MHIFHEWSNYGEPFPVFVDPGYSFSYTVMKQRKICKKCGKQTDTKTNLSVPSIPSVPPK